jgi:integrase
VTYEDYPILDESCRRMRPCRSRRQKKPLTLTPDEYDKVQARLPQPYQTMPAVAMCLGLRVSEVLGLKWSDFDFDALTVTVQRGVVHGRIADTKTEASTDELPLDPAFAELLKEWQAQAPKSEAGWVFASYDGKPFHAAPIQQDYFRPAGRAVGLKVNWAGMHSATRIVRCWTHPGHPSECSRSSCGTLR